MSMSALPVGHRDDCSGYQDFPSIEVQKIDRLVQTMSTSGGSELYFPIAQLSTYTPRWCILARVVDKGTLMTFSKQNGDFRVLNVDIMDKQGDSIRAKLWNEAVDKFQDLIQKGSVYSFRNGRVTVANKRFNPLPHNYEISFYGNAEIKKIGEDSSKEAVSIPSQRKYNFLNLRDVKNSTRQLPYQIDLLAVVRNFRDCEPFSVRRGSFGGSSFGATGGSSSEQTYRRQITVVDDSQLELDVTLWGAQAQIADEKLTNYPVVCITNLQIREWRGLVGSTVRGSNLEFELDDIPRAVQLRQWFQGEGRSCEFSNLGGEAGGPRGGRSDAAASTKELNLAETFEDLKTLTVGENRFYQTIAEVGRIFTTNRNGDFAGLYSACPRCNRKVIEDAATGDTRCEGCSAAVEPTSRYTFGVGLVDHTGGRFVARAFHDAGKVIVGVNATTIKNVLNDPDAKVTKLWETFDFDPLWKPYKFRLRGRLDTFNGEERKNVGILSLEPLDFEQHSAKMLREIRQKYPNATSFIQSRKHKSSDDAIEDTLDEVRREGKKIRRGETVDAVEVQ